MKRSWGLCVGTLLLTTLISNADWESRFTQIINDVRVEEQTTKQGKTAAVGLTLRAPTVVRTGAASRAELSADDQVITRIGANSLVSFNGVDGTILLEKGSLLFNAPKGKGGGKILTRSAVASVLGTTMIVSATPDGGMKVLLLEGSGRVALSKGRSVKLDAGQMVFVLPNEKGLSPVLNFKLEDQVQGSQLVKGFGKPLPSFARIESEISRQNKRIESGEAMDTGLLVGGTATGTEVQVVDANLLQQLFQQDGQTDGSDVIRHSDFVINQFLNRDGQLNYTPGAAELLADNIRIIGPTVDLSGFAGTESLYLEGDTIQFDPNRTRGISFFGGANGVHNLHLIARDYVLPLNHAFYFDGRTFVLEDLSDMTLNGGRFGTTFGVNYENGYLVLAAAGVMSLGDISLSGYSLRLAAAKGINVGGANPGGSRFAATSSLSLQAANQISMSNVSITAPLVNISARTVVLQSVNFDANSVVHLTSERGQLAANPNTGASVQPGYVNFIYAVTYGGVPAQNAIGNGIFLH